MIKKSLIFSVLISTVINAEAHEVNKSNQPGMYLSVPFGYGFTQQPKNAANSDSLYSGKFKKPLIFGMGCGYDFGSTRLEANWNHRAKAGFSSSASSQFATSTQSQSAKVNTFMVNGFKDFHNISDKLSPYVTAGLGVSNIKSGDVKVSEHYKGSGETYNFTGAGASKNSLSWQVGFGVSHHLNKNIDLDLGYRYTHLGKITGTDPILKKSSSYTLISNDVMFTVRIKL